MNEEDARKSLIGILQAAYSGELAAAFAYRGHWKSLKKSAEREKIRQIEAEEWAHRKAVGRWLEKLEAKPRKLREAIFRTIGRTLGLTCRVSGWFLSMYFAGKLESGNVLEYEEAAKYAEKLGMRECCDEMTEMSRVERQHEDFFRQVVANHRLLPATKKYFRWG